MFVSRVILSLFALLLTAVQAHNVLLPPHGRRCFYENLKKGDELIVSFQVGDRNPSSTHQLKTDFAIYGQRNEIIENVHGAAHGQVTTVASYEGKYKYCFINDYDSTHTKDVSFNVHGVKYVDADDQGTLDGAMAQLSRLAHDVKHEQGYIVIRERTHRNTAESTNDRVKWWSVFQLVVVVGNSIFQIYYLKRFFEVTSVV